MIEPGVFFFLWGSHAAATCLQRCTWEQVHHSASVWACRVVTCRGAELRDNLTNLTGRFSSLCCSNFPYPLWWEGRGGIFCLTVKKASLLMATRRKTVVLFEMISWGNVKENNPHISRMTVQSSCCEGRSWPMQASSSPLMWEVTPLTASPLSRTSSLTRQHFVNRAAPWMRLLAVRKFKFTLAHCLSVRLCREFLLSSFSGNAAWL